MECLGDAFGGSLQPVEGGVPADGEFAFTGLAEEIPNGLVPAMVSVTDQSMNGRVGDFEVLAIGVGTGIALRGDGLFAATRAFALGVRDHGFGVDRCLTAFSTNGTIARGAGP
jgi:hypothetical protein